MKQLYGYNLEDDMKRLYGENYEEINNIRMELWGNMSKYNEQLNSLKSIIQNPVPITSNDLFEWKKLKFKLESDGEFSKKMLDILEKVEKFVMNYHLIDVEDMENTYI